MEALSKKIGAECHVFDEYCRTTGYPMPSLERTTPSFSLPHEAPTEVHVARERIMSYALNLFQLAAGPSEYLANLQTGVSITIVEESFSKYFN
jgi:6-hydroxytryprostatin B O-methyltransferase